MMTSMMSIIMGLLLLIADGGALRVEPLRVSRRAALSAVATAHVLLPPAAVQASAAETRAMLKEARAQLDPCEGYINDGSWDGVRNAVKTAPLANVKNLLTKYIKEKGEEAEDLVRKPDSNPLEFLCPSSLQSAEGRTFESHSGRWSPVRTSSKRSPCWT